MSYQALGDLVTVDPYNMVSLTGKPSLGSGVYLDADPNNSSFLFQTNSGDALYVDKFHNVGINTRSPTAQLDINGTNTHIQLTYNNTINKATMDVSSSGKLALTSTGGEINTDVNSSFDVKAHDGSTKGLKLGGVLLTATAAQLNSLAGGSSGGSTFTVADTITITNANGVDKGLILGSTLVTSSAAELNYLDGATPGTVVASKAVVVDANKDITGGRNTSVTGSFTTTATTDSSSVSTGTIVTAGGVGIAKNLYVGGNQYITSYTGSSNSSSGALVVNGGVGIGGVLSLGSNVTVANGTDSTSTTTGAMTLVGGVGIGRRLNTGNTITSAAGVVASANVSGNNVTAAVTVSSSNVMSSTVNLVSEVGSPFDTSLITTFTNTGNTNPMMSAFYSNSAINGVLGWNGGGTSFLFTSTGYTVSNVSISSALSTTLSGLGYTSISNHVGVTATPDGNVWGAFRGTISAQYYGLLLKGTVGGGFTSLAFATPGSGNSGIGFDYIVNLSNTSLVCGRTDNGIIYYTTDGTNFNTSATTGFNAIKPMFGKYIRNVSSNVGGSCLSYSADGNSWTACTVPTNNRTMRYLHYNSTMDKGFAFDASHNYVWVTADGITWTEATIPALTGITFNAGLSSPTSALFVIYPTYNSTTVTGVYTLDGVTFTTFNVGDKNNLPYANYSVSVPGFELGYVPSTNRAIWPITSGGFSVIISPVLTFSNKVFKSSAASGYVIDQTDVGFKWKTGASQSSAGTDRMTLNGTLTVSVPEAITNATSSTTTTTGALVVSGGVGIAENLNVGGTTDATSSTTGAMTLAGGMGIAKNLYIGGTTTSTSTSTGSVVAAGGVGIAENLYVGGNMDITTHNGSTAGLKLAGTLVTATAAQLNALTSASGPTTFTVGDTLTITNANGTDKGLVLGSTLVTATATELNYLDGVTAGSAVASKALVVDANSDISAIRNLSTTGTISTSLTTDASSSTTGALTVAGGVGIAKKLYVGSTTGSTSTGTGALVVSGGTGVAENLYVGGNAVVAGNLTVSGTTTTVNSTVVNIADNTLVLNAGPSGSGKDAGILMSRYQVDNDAGTGDVVSDTAKYTTTIDSSADSTHITLASGANTNNDYYNDWWIKITSGSAVNNVRKITAYDGATLTATLSSALSASAANADTISLFNKPFPTFIWQEATDRFIATFAPIDSTTTINTQDYADVGVSRVFANSTTGSTSTSSGALVVSGGAGIAENLYIGGSLNVNGTSATNTTLGYLTSITPGTVAASKALVVDADKDLSSIRNLTTVTLNISGHDGSTTGLSLGGTLVTATASELNYVDVTAGAGTASKAVVLDSSKNISGINKVGTTSLRIGTPASDALPVEVGYVSYQFAGAFAYANSNNAHGLVEAGAAASANYSMRTDGRILCTGELEITSDRRLKENIIELTPDFSKRFIMTTTPVKFNWRTGDKIIDYGYIAQDIYKKGFTDLVTITPSNGMVECIDDDGFISPKDAKFVFSPGKIIPMLALNQKEIFEELKDKDERIAELEGRIAQLEEIVKKLLK